MISDAVTFDATVGDRLPRRELVVGPVCLPGGGGPLTKQEVCDRIFASLERNDERDGKAYFGAGQDVTVDNSGES